MQILGYTMETKAKSSVSDKQKMELECQFLLVLDVISQHNHISLVLMHCAALELQLLFLR